MRKLSIRIRQILEPGCVELAATLRRDVEPLLTVL